MAVDLDQVPDAKRDVIHHHRGQARVVDGLQLEVDDAMDHELADHPEQNLGEPEPYRIRKEDRNHVEKPSGDVDERAVGLVKRIAVRWAIPAVKHLVQDLWRPAGPAHLLKLVCHQHHEVDQEDQLHPVQVADHRPDDRQHGQHQADGVPAPNNIVHTRAA